jgi:hypothetical protein
MFSFYFILLLWNTMADDFLIFKEAFLWGVRRAILVEAGADAAPALEHEAGQPRGDFAVETELDHALYDSVYGFS